MSRRRRLTYQPALDGIRALAVLVVILFHAGVPGFGGGYVGVSVFFTLSGFLITSLLVAERLQDESIDLGGFYARRARRLLPASILCVVGVVIASATTDWFAHVGDLRTQVVGSLLQVENWVLLAGAGSYQRLFADGDGSASPLAHFWSLAIEEQFYWIWPVTLWAIFRVRSPRRSVTGTAATLEGSVKVPADSTRSSYPAPPERVKAGFRGRHETDDRAVVDRSAVDETGEVPAIGKPVRSTDEIWAIRGPVWQPDEDGSTGRRRVGPYPIVPHTDLGRRGEIPVFPAPTTNPKAGPATETTGIDETGEIPALVGAPRRGAPGEQRVPPPPRPTAERAVIVPQSVVIAVVALTVLAAGASPVIAWVWGSDAAYWSTPARLAEILVGASAAVLLYGHAIGRRWDRLGWIGLAALTCCVALFPIAGGPAYQGAMPIVALASVALVIGGQANGLLQRVLSFPALVAVGKVSYGAYLYHWPIFVVVNESRTGLDPIPVFAARLAITAAATLISYRLIERPVRRTRGLAASTTLVAGLTVTGLAIVLAGTLVPANAPYWETTEANAAEVAIRPEQIEPRPATTSPPVVVATAPPPNGSVPSTGVAPSSTVSTTSSTSAVTTSAPASTPAPTSSLAAPAHEADSDLVPIDRPLRVIVAGDSTGGTLATGLIEWAVDHPDVLQIEDLHVGGCGVLTGGDRLYGTWGAVPEGCDRHIRADLPAAVKELQPDVVVISAAVWDLPDRRWDGVVYTPFDQYFQDRLLFEYTLTANHSIDAGAKSVALIINPVPNTDWKGDAPSDDPDRQAVLDSILRRIAANRPEQIRAVDLRQYVDGQQLGFDRAARPDGVHWTTSTSKAIAQDFLVAELFRAASVLPPDGVGSATPETTSANRPAGDPSIETEPVTSAP